MSVGIIDNVPGGWQCCRHAGAVAVSEPEAVGQGAIVEEVIWRLPQSEPGRPHGYKYRLAYVREGRRLIGYDNERSKGDHRHYGDHEEEYRFMSIEQLLDNFRADLMREEENQ